MLSTSDPAALSALPPAAPLLRKGMRQPIVITSAPPRPDYATAAILVASVSLNAILSIVNAWAYAVNSSILIALQAVVTLAGALILAFRADIRLLRLALWTASLGTLMGVGAYNHGLTAKDANDLLLIPLFLGVGLTARRFPTKCFFYIFSAVTLIALLEVFSLSGYLALFKPIEYLASTRDWIGDQVAANGSKDGLYIGAARGGGSIFSVADHRIGSIFLEPLSLGYFAVISAMIFTVTYRSSFVKMSLTMAACAILALLADSRVGTGLVVLFWLLSFAPKRLPRGFGYAAPIAVLFLAVMVFVFSLASGAGDTMSRLGITVSEAGRAPFVELLIGNVSQERFNDSGILRIVYCTTLFGLFVALPLYSGTPIGRFPGLTLVPVLASIYITVTALFGGAFMSIKTAALFGIFVGAAANGRVEALQSRKQRNRLARPAPLGALSATASGDRPA